MLTVSQIIANCRSLIERGWPTAAQITGELSNVRTYPSGHAYFTLKDDAAEVACIMFARDRQAHAAGTFPSDGDQVAVAARPTVYEPRGRLQLRVITMRRHGVGDIHARFVAIKQELRDKGWFDADRKRTPPRFPQAVGVVASADGAALRDVLATLAKRYPQAAVMLFPAPAQGIEAAGKIAAAIRQAGDFGCDSLIVCRGGGSLEDLWSYNEIEVAQAILESPIPVIAGIGHETDETIADYVADVRAATPTAAAVAAVPDRSALLRDVAAWTARLLNAVRMRADSAAQRADEAAADLRAGGGRLSAVSGARAQAAAAGLAGAARLRRTTEAGRLAQARSSLIMQLRIRAQSAGRMRKLAPALTRAAQRAAARSKAEHSSAADELCKAAVRRSRTAAGALAGLNARLDSASPQRVLERGYAIVERTGKGAGYVQRASGLSAGDEAALIFADGRADATVVGVSAERFAPGKGRPSGRRKG